MSSERPSTYFVIFHQPGPAWEPGIDFREQSHVGTHVQYYAEQAARGLVVLGGPFLDRSSGGMMIVRASSEDEAEHVALGDPAVEIGFVTATVRPWLAAMSSETGSPSQ